jgi:hypothetical protein
MLVAGMALLLTLSACSNNSSLLGTQSPQPRTPREAYLVQLASNGLYDTRMAALWREAGDQALSDSVLQEAPFQETGYFRAEEPMARVYRMELLEGEVLRMNLISLPDSTLFFLDLFREEPTDSSLQYRQVFHAENYQTDSLSYEIEEAGIYLLRIQPELLAAGRFNMELIVQPVYGAFPVSGKGNRDIWSFWGDPRDGGRRSHQGIDIFARRGTPVVAAVDGIVRSVRNRGLGGKQVWLSDPARRQSLYYAHLDSQLVTEGQRVQAGDTLGWVGNTGNARNTRPHLHFGIYRRGQGAIDPHPFVAFQDAEAPAITADTARLGHWGRTSRSNTTLQAAPEPSSKSVATLDRHLPLQIIGASKFWYRVLTPEGQSGYLPVNRIENVERAVRTITLTESAELLNRPRPDANPIGLLSAETAVAVLGQHGAFQLVEDQGLLGWLSVPIN